MKQITRYAIVLILFVSVIFLARNPAAGAMGRLSPADQSGLAKLQGFVWDDVDRDGVQDPGEAGVPNVSVNLFDKAKKLVNTVNTDATGHYVFENLAPGDYYVGFVPPDGFVISPKDQSNDDALDSDADSTTGETTLTTLVAGDNLLKWDAGVYSTTPPAAQDPGTVKPPPPEVTICGNGVVSVGGVSTLQVNNLASGYCLAAFLRNEGFALGRIPDGAGTVLARITFLRVFYNGILVHDLPTQDGQVQICYYVDPEVEQAQIYFFDFYGPRTNGRQGQPSWQPLETTVQGNIACAAAQSSGAYALIGK
jgi:hypothetical protein